MRFRERYVRKGRYVGKGRYWESGTLGKWDFANVGFGASGILGKWDFGKWHCGKKWDFEEVVCFGI